MLHCGACFKSPPNLPQGSLLSERNMAPSSPSSQSQNAEEEVTPESDVALEEANSHIDEALNILKRETVKSRRERESVAKKSNTPISSKR